VLFDPGLRKRAFAALVVVGALSLLLDGLRTYADGRANFWLYPLWWRPPTPNLYVSAAPQVLAVALYIAVVVFPIDTGRLRRLVW
jgi:hypothetical protein